jgi:hypothetical protein
MATISDSLLKGAVLVWILALCCTIVFGPNAIAQSKGNIVAQGKYQMLIENSITRDQAKRIAIERARIDALRREFGEIVVQGNSTYLRSTGNGDLQSSTNAFNFMSETLVNGEWVSDIKEPIINYTTRTSGADEEQWIKVEVYGYVRALEAVVHNCKVKTLSCPMITCGTTTYNHGQSFYLAFQSPVSGYLAVYLDSPEEQRTFKILPYSRMAGNSSIPIEADKLYIFFDKQSEKEMKLSLTDQLELTIEGALNPQELNKLFIIFSPYSDLGKPILKASDSNPPSNASAQYTLPLHLPSPDFQQWLNTLRSKDRRIQLYTENITINR